LKIKGKEFYNKIFEKYLKKKNIHMYSTNSDQKSSIIERFNRSLKTKMYKYFTSVQNKNWISVIDDLVDSYNKTYHRTIRTTPNNVTDKNQLEIFQNIYGFAKEKFSDQKLNNLEYKIGDKVRISKIKNVFDKGYLKAWTTELFEIEQILATVPETYKLIDLLGEKIIGGFYKEEIQIANNFGKVFKIDKILKEKTQNNKKLYLVRWLGYAKKFDTWLEEDQIKLI